MWIIRLLVDDESILEEVYKALKGMDLGFDMKYLGNETTFYIRTNEVMKALDVIKTLNARFKRRFENNIYESTTERRLR